MDCFIKKIWERKGREKQAHQYFVRFSKGKFENRAVLNLQKTTKIKLRGSFEWVNDFVELVLELDKNAVFSGIILTKQKTQELQEFDEKKKKNIFEYKINNINLEKIQETEDKAYYMLLDGQGDGIILKIKKKLPRPKRGKESKVDDKFCQLEADLKYWSQIREAFMLPECKKCKVSHVFIIDEIILPKTEEKDFEKIRLIAKRKGKIIRKIVINKQEFMKETEFEV